MTNAYQPEALRLAKILEDHYFYSDTNEAAAELRRLHAAKGRYHTQHALCDLFDICGLPNERPTK